MEEVGSIVTECRPPLPPFTLETAIQEVQAAEDANRTRGLPVQAIRLIAGYASNPRSKLINWAMSW